MKILFLCVANSARSQMAEGLARALLPSAQIQSAGSQPGKLNPNSVLALREIGIDISSHFSKGVSDLKPEFLSELDFVITLCAEEICPVLSAPHAEKLHWPFPDPAIESQEPAEALNRFRNVRDAIQLKLKNFAQEIGR